MRQGHTTLLPVRAGAFLLGVLCLALVRVTSAPAAPAMESWPRWEAHDPASNVTVDHGTWNVLLARYLGPEQNGLRRFDYGAVDVADGMLLSGYLADLQAVSVSSLARPEQMAFWINLYNALTVRVILDHYPVGSIRDIDISPGFFSDGPWGRKLVAVEGEDLSLDDIEHRILRPIWRDPRIHYAVNCASVGCPSLAAEAYAGARMDEMLDAAARAFVNSTRGVDPEGNAVRLSRIYDWYAGDFGDNETALLRHLASHADRPLAERLSAMPRIEGYFYDWALNDRVSGSPVTD